MSGAGRSASLRTIARRALGGETRLERGTKLLVAVSGGPDSMALLHVLADAASGFGLTVLAHGVDHGLRAEASRELDGAAALAEGLGVAFARTRVSLMRGGNLQARARVARWTALVAAARASGARAIATAHHADDRAETLLIRLLRGAGARGLAVMPARAPAPGGRDIDVIRPLLRARKSDILSHVARRKLPHARDPSNEDPRFVRTRVRRELMPLLEQLSPSIVEHLEALADELCERGAPGRPGEHIGDATAIAAAPDVATISTELLAPAWASRLPRRTQEALRDLIRTGSTSARVWLPGGWVVSRDGRARPPASARTKA